jgi:hypothetical protein
MIGIDKNTIYLHRADDVAACLPIAADILRAGRDEVAQVQVAVQAQALTRLV